MLTKKFCFMIFLKLYFKPVTVSIYQPHFTLDTLGLDLKPTQLTPWPNLPHPTLLGKRENPLWAPTPYVGMSCYPMQTL